MNKGVHPPQCTDTFFPLSHSHPPSFLPRVFFLFVLNIHLLAGLWWCQLASQSFSFHTGDTRPQHVKRFQTHLKSVHKRRKRKHHKNAAFTRPLHAHLCTYSTPHRHCGHISSPVFRMNTGDLPPHLTQTLCINCSPTLLRFCVHTHPQFCLFITKSHASLLLDICRCEK